MPGRFCAPFWRILHGAPIGRSSSFRQRLPSAPWLTCSRSDTTSWSACRIFTRRTREPSPAKSPRPWRAMRGRPSPSSGTRSADTCSERPTRKRRRKWPPRYEPGSPPCSAWARSSKSARQIRPKLWCCDNCERVSRSSSLVRRSECCSRTSRCGPLGRAGPRRRWMPASFTPSFGRSCLPSWPRGRMEFRSATAGA